jgi:hypothetical protein
MSHQDDFEREVTAYHEAGHAVIAYVLGYKPKSATIIPTRDANGTVKYQNPCAAFDSKLTCRTGRAGSWSTQFKSPSPDRTHSANIRSMRRVSIMGHSILSRSIS